MAIEPVTSWSLCGLGWRHALKAIFWVVYCWRCTCLLINVLFLCLMQRWICVCSIRQTSLYSKVLWSRFKHETIRGTARARSWRDASKYMLIVLVDSFMTVLFRYNFCALNTITPTWRAKVTMCTSSWWHMYCVLQFQHILYLIITAIIGSVHVVYVVRASHLQSEGYGFDCPLI